MPRPNPDLIQALQETADRLDSGARYEWGHMGRCNCGHLVQTVTSLTDLEIVDRVSGQLDEWTEHARAYCPGVQPTVPAQAYWQGQRWWWRW